MRNSSIRLLICNIDCRRSTMRTDRNVVGEQPHEPVTNTTHAINHIQVNEYDDTSEVVIKTEYDGDHAVTTQGEGAGDSLLWEDSKTEISLCGKKEVDFVIKTEDDMDEMIIKQELDIEPTVLQPKTVPRPLSPPTMVRFNLRTSTSSGGDAFPTPLYRSKFVMGYRVINSLITKISTMLSMTFITDNHDAFKTKPHKNQFVSFVPEYHPTNQL